MCSPAFGVASSLAGGGLAAYGQLQAGNAANAAGIRDQNIANQNADVLEGQARDATERGEFAVDKLRTDAARDVGEGRAGFAGGNVDLSSGAAAYWELDSAKTTAADVGTTRYNAKQEAFGKRVDARNERVRGQMRRYEGKVAQKSSRFAAAGTLLGSAGQAASFGPR
jgi:hypothetical protein